MSKKREISQIAENELSKLRAERASAFSNSLEHIKHKLGITAKDPLGSPGGNGSVHSTDDPGSVVKLTTSKREAQLAKLRQHTKLGAGILPKVHQVWKIPSHLTHGHTVYVIHRENADDHTFADPSKWHNVMQSVDYATHLNRDLGPILDNALSEIHPKDVEHFKKIKNSLVSLDSAGLRLRDFAPNNWGSVGGSPVLRDAEAIGKPLEKVEIPELR